MTLQGFTLGWYAGPRWGMGTESGQFYGFAHVGQEFQIRGQVIDPRSSIRS